MLFSQLSQYFQKLESTASRNAMTEILAELFRESGKDEIGKLCYLLQGRVAPLYEPIEFGIADKLMIRAIALSCDVKEAHVVQAFKKLGDLGSTAEHIKYQISNIKYIPHQNKFSAGQAPQKVNIEKTYETLLQLATTNGEGSQEKKIALLGDLIRSVDPLSARYLVRIPLDKLRLGFSDMTILDALSWMIAGDKSLRGKLEDAYNVRPDIGWLAEQIRNPKSEIRNFRAEPKLGTPILASLCQRLPTADEMIKKMGEVAVEPKWDGVRVQIHVEKSKIKNQKSKISTFSRNLENTTSMFPELQGAVRQIEAGEVILDSEAVGVDPKTGRLIPFQETVTRKRKHDIAASLLKVPLKFFVFDILYKDGKDLIEMPLSERRKILEETINRGNRGNRGDMLVISPQIITRDAAVIRQYHDKQLKMGLEGAVVKKWRSPYEPGRRGYSWVKFKEEEGKHGALTDTIDAVVMGYYRGEGKRAGFGIGAFLVGVRKGEEFVTVTKIGTGVSDELWKKLKKAFSRQSSAVRPKEYADVSKMLIPDVWIRPSIVVEVAGDDLTRSPTHGAGYAIRFPRLVRIRTDKGPREATTVEEVEALYRQQSTKER